MYRLLAISHTSLDAVLQYPLRSAATVGCLVALLLPYVAGIALSEGLQEQAEDAVRFGADLYVTGAEFGREVPLPVAQADDLRRIDGVTEVVPRIVAGVVLGKNRENAVLVGLPRQHFPAAVTCVDGELPRAGSINQLVVGTELARRLGLRVGSMIPPFYHNARGDRISKVVGIFKSDVPVWEANLILTTFETAAAVCNQKGLATDLLVYCRPGYHDSVRAAIRRSGPPPSAESGPRVGLQVVAREDLRASLPRGVLHRAGIFNLLFVVAFAAGILTLLVTSGVGTAERRREIGILKATGWQTDEVLLRGLVESLVLSLAGAGLSILLAYLWLRPLNGYGIAGVLLAGAGVRPGFTVPFRLTPVPALLAVLISGALVLTGTLYSTWRAAVVPPRAAMR
jgi:ABC-type lipoprotein release transport system permease subunit